MLRSVRSGEYHKALTILTPGEGLLRAMAFGAYKGKSKLSGATEPFTEGEFFLYRNPVKEQVKISDIAPGSVHEPVRRDLKRLYTASFWAELVIKTYGGGGEYEKLYRFFRRGLEYLETVRETEIDLLKLQFFWRYIEFLGMMPSLEECADCGRGMEPEEPMYLGEGELLCGECAPAHAESLEPAGRAYLLETAGRAFSRVRERMPDEPVLRRLLRFSYAFAETAVGTAFNSLKRGAL